MEEKPVDFISCTSSGSSVTGFFNQWVLHRGQSNFQNTYCLFGLLAHTMGDLDKSTGHFDEVLEYARRAGFRPMLA